MLAQYNSEKARGIVHTIAWKEKMRRIQEDYDEVVTRVFKGKGGE